MTLSGQFLRRFYRDFHLGTGGDQDHVWLAAAVFQDVPAAGDIFHLLRRAFDLRQVLARQDQRRRSVMTLYGQLPAHCRFNLIARTPGAEVWR